MAPDTIQTGVGHANSDSRRRTAEDAAMPDAGGSAMLGAAAVAFSALAQSETGRRASRALPSIHGRLGASLGDSRGRGAK